MNLVLRIALVPLVITFQAVALPTVAVAQGGAFGSAVAVADVDGDGFDDVIVGEPLFDGSGVDEGRVLVFLGSASGPAATPAWSRSGAQSHARFGATLATLDANGDGYADLAVGAPDFDVRLRRAQLDGAASSALPDAGLVAVFLGSPSGLASQPALFRPGLQRREHVGAALASAGDVDGDGDDELLVGATGTNGRRGIVLLFAGSPAGPGALPAWLQLGSVVDGGLGSVLAGGGDTNADGFDDVLIGVPDGGVERGGEFQLFRGSASGLPAAPSWSLAPEGGDDGFDNGVSDWGAHLCLADLNGDGFDDVFVGNPTFDADLGHGAGVWPDSGMVFLYRGSAGAPPAYATRVPGVVAHSSVRAGDLDGDGDDEVAAGSDNGFLASMLFFGHPTFFFGDEGFAYGDQCAAGDVDGDGFDDLAVGDASHAVPQPASGSVNVYGGSPDMAGGGTWTLAAP